MIGIYKDSKVCYLKDGKPFYDTVEVFYNIFLQDKDVKIKSLSFDTSTDYAKFKSILSFEKSQATCINITDYTNNNSLNCTSDCNVHNYYSFRPALIVGKACFYDPLTANKTGLLNDSVYTDIYNIQVEHESMADNNFFANGFLVQTDKLIQIV